MTRTASDKPHEGELPDVGDVLQGAYRLTDIVASGGMGVIMQATHLKMERDVAVKLLHPHMASQPKQVQRFEREIQLAKILSHPNIIQVFDYGRTDSEALFIVMEYLEGRDLKALIDEEGPVPLGRACNIALQVLDGLAEAHDSDVIHRDLKPSNIFLMRRRRGGAHVKLLDFGVAKSLKGDATAITAAGQTCGTAAYMPPESFLRGFPGKPGDVYAVGLIILEMLFGGRVFEQDSIHQTLIKHVQEPIPIPSALLETPVGEVIEKGTAKHPDDRYPDAEAMLQDLAPAVDKLDDDRRIDPTERTETGTYVDEAFPEEQAGSDAILESLRLDAAPADGSASGETRDAAAAGDGSSSSEEVHEPEPTVETQTDPSPRFDEHPDPTADASASSSDADTRVDASAGAPGSPEERERSSWLLPATAGAGVTLAIILLFAFTRSPGPSVSTTTSTTESRGAPTTSSENPASPSAPESDPPEASNASDESESADDSRAASGANKPVRAVISTSPSGADIFVEGGKVGTTPKLVEFEPTASQVEVRLEKEGFRPATAALVPQEAKSRYEVDLEPKPGHERPSDRTADDSETTAEQTSGGEASGGKAAGGGKPAPAEPTPDRSAPTAATADDSESPSGSSNREREDDKTEETSNQNNDESFEEIAEDFSLD